MKKKPIWLLDVDGVLNAITYNNSPIYTRTVCAANGQMWPIRYRPAVVDFINTVVSEAIVDVVWLTTWGKMANGDLREQLGLPVLEVAGEVPGHFEHTMDWWKLDVVLAHPEWDDRPIVWTDDDFTLSRSAINWVAAQKGRVLAIAPKSHLALSDKALELIYDFLMESAEAV